MRALEFLQERLLVAAAADVVANVIGIGKRQNHQVMAASVAERTRAGGLGLFVLGFAMNDGSSRFASVFAHAFPNAHHVAASGIDNLAAAILDLLLDRQLSSKCRDEHDVFGSEIGNVRLFILAGEIF